MIISMSSTIRPIIQATYEQVSDDTKLVRLTTITKLIHSALFLFFMAMNIYYVVMRIVEGSTVIGWWTAQILKRVTDNFPLAEYGWLVVGVGILIVIWYYLFPPIGEGALIAYLADDEKKGSAAMIEWFSNFFRMLEFRSMTSIFSPLFFAIFASRFRVMDVIDNRLVGGVVILWWLLMIFTQVFFSFSQYYIVLEWTRSIDAMTKSMRLSLQHFGKIIKATILQFILAASFIINILIFFGIPFIIFYAWIQFWGEINGVLWTILVVIAVILWLLLSHINGIIESFFITLWYRLFIHLRQ